ncbi:MAG: phospho-N-acetylmuramoyl-pentapeptide-transferase [Clostridiales bacterium]|nr:phospho-N-acetylmuramoyl-pentapeptide-transferase [Clostridiales bacterium]
MKDVVYAAIFSLVLTIVVGKIILPLLERLKFGQQIRDDGPSSHLKKAGTPTMGGIMFLIPLFIVSYIFSSKSLDFITAAILVSIGYSLIGLIDDYIMIGMKRSLGLRAYQKIAAQIFISVIFALYAYRHPDIGSSIYIPFSGDELELGIWYIPFVVFVLLGTVNSTNLTDGLDGLLSSVSIIVAATLGVIALFASKKAYDEGLVYVSANYENLVVFAATLVGGCLGFLYYNAHPAKVFMGDTGSFGIGGAIVAMVILLKLPLLLPIIGGIYMIESLSVIVQVVSFKLTGKRVFKMSPLHHHFELKGMKETEVVTMFVIITMILCLIGLLIV